MKRVALALPLLLPGVVAGLINISYAIAFSTIIFSGDLASYLPIGIGIGLFSAAVVAMTTALLSSVRGTITIVQEVPVFLLALAVRGFIGDLSAAERLPTVLVLLASTSLLVGTVTFLLGQFRWGNWIRFIPYPIIGGFLGGTGWFLSLGGVLMLTRTSELHSLGQLFNAIALLQWLPGLAFALVMLWLQRRSGHPLAFPGLLVGSVALFFIMLGITQTSLAQVQGLGLLLGPFADSSPWRPLTGQTWAQANWSAIGQQWDQLAVLLAVTLMALLLNITSLEVVVRQDINLNHELRTVGIANVLSGLGGGLVGFHGLGATALCKDRLHGHSRWVGLIAALLTATVLVLGTDFIGFIPRFVLGGLVLYLGIDFLVDWVWLSRQRLPTVDYLMIVTLVIIMATVGILPAVGIGLAFAIAFFLLNYSRTNVIRHQFSGQILSSHTHRAPHQQAQLHTMGEQIQILQLQGYLFFGSADQLLRDVKHLFETASPTMPQFIVLNFSQITGMDSSVVYSFAKLGQIAPPHSKLVLTHLTAAHQKLLRQAGCFDSQSSPYHLEATLDGGLQWCENELLATLAWKRQRYLPLPLLLETLFSQVEQISTFMTYLEKANLLERAVLFEQGAIADKLYFLEFGQVYTQITVAGQPYREWTYKPSTLIGTAAFYLNQPYETTALAEQPSIVYVLTRDRWQTMKQIHPAAAMTFQEALLTQLSEQLQRTSLNLNTLRT